MANNIFLDIFETSKPIIGMVHLKALPGTAAYNEKKGMAWIVDHAVSEARKLEAGGIDGIQIENQFDKPFCRPEEIGPEIVAAIAAASMAVKKAVDLPFGINVHLNGVKQALAIAAAVNAGWVRAFELANAYISNSGIIEAAGPEAVRYRRMLDAENIKIFGDFHVKHGSHFILSDRTIEEQVDDVKTGGGSAVILTSTATGKAPTVEDAQRIKKATELPVLIGSGFSLENAEDLLSASDGAIVGSSLKINGKIVNDTDPERVKKLMDLVKSVRN